MGIYINKGLEDHKVQQMLTWAKEGNGLQAVRLEEAMQHNAGQDGKFVVVVFCNGIFDAAGVAFDQREQYYFLTGANGRECHYFIATLDWLKSKDPAAAKAVEQVQWSQQP